MSTLKEKLYAELLLKMEIAQEGITFDKKILEQIGLGGKRQEQVQCLFNYNREADASLDLPPFMVLPHGLTTFFLYDRKAPNRLTFDSKGYYVVRQNGDAVPVVPTRCVLCVT